MDYELASDEALLEQIAKQDADALEAFYDRHAQTTYNLILRIVRTPAVADELLQESFWQVWQKAGDYNHSGAAAAWLYRIARNKSLDQLRRRKTRPQPILTGSDEEEATLWNTLEADETGVEQGMEQRWNRQRIRQALDAIPSEQRLCLELAYWEGMSQSQIAEYTEHPAWNHQDTRPYRNAETRTSSSYFCLVTGYCRLLP